MTVRKNLLYCVFSKFDRRKTRNDDILRVLCAASIENYLPFGRGDTPRDRITV
jgi:hypothetical protein